MLAAHPEAFTSDAATESAGPLDYLRGSASIAATAASSRSARGTTTRLVGAISCERETRLKVRHIGHIIGMMVRAEARGRGIGRAAARSLHRRGARTPVSRC